MKRRMFINRLDERASEEDLLPIHVSRSHYDQVHALTVIGNKVITCSEDRDLNIFYENQEAITLFTFGDPINHLATDEAKEYLLACCDDSSIYVIEIATQEIAYRIEGFDGSYIRKAAFCGDYIVAATENGQIGIYHIKTQKLRLFSTHDATVDALAAHPNGFLFMSNDMSGRTLIWDVENGEIIKELLPKRGRFIRGMFHYGANSAVWTKNHLIIGEKTVLIYNNDYELLYSYSGLEFTPSDLLVHQNILWICSMDLIGVELHTFHKVAIVGLNPRGSAIGIGSDGYLWTGHSNGEIKKWNSADIKLSKKSDYHNGTVQTLKKNNHLIATASRDGSLRVWNDEGVQVFKHVTEDPNIAVITLYPNNELIFIADQTLYAYAFKSQSVKSVAGLKYNYHIINDAIAFNDKILYSSVGKNPRMYDFTKKSFTEYDTEYYIYNFSNIVENTLLFVCLDYYTDQQRGRLKNEPSNDTEPIHPKVYIFNTVSCTIDGTLELPGHLLMKNFAGEKNHPVKSLLLKGQKAIIAYDEGTIALWDLHTREILYQIHKPGLYVSEIHQLSDGNLFIGGNLLLILSPQLVPLVQSDFRLTHQFIHLDEEAGLVIVQYETLKELKFVALTSFEPRFTFKLKASADQIVRRGNKYLVFTKSQLEIFELEWV